jgi:GNAT superfamily N-acetyltransferase
VTRTQLGQPAPDTARSGGAVHIRGAVPADCDAIRSFVSGLSLRARFLRFFTPIWQPSSAMLRRMCGGDGAADALVATDGSAIIGHAMASDAVGPDGCLTADIGLVVADHWQNRGVGSEMLGRLVRRAAERGVSVLVMDVLPENRRMLAMISHRWADAGYHFAGGSVTVRVPLHHPATAKGHCRDAALRTRPAAA